LINFAAYFQGIKMKQRHIRMYVLFVTLLSSALTAFAQSDGPSKPLDALEQTLMSAEKDFIAAAKKGDPAFLKRTMADDFSFVSFDGEMGDRQDMINGLGGGGVDLLPYEMEVIPISDGVAIVTYNVVLRVPPSEDEGPPPRYQHFSTVWVKQNDKQSDTWKMKFLQMTVAHFGDY
jgi:hypothetical protein